MNSKACSFTFTFPRLHCELIVKVSKALRKLFLNFKEHLTFTEFIIHLKLIALEYQNYFLK